MKLRPIAKVTAELVKLYTPRPRRLRRASHHAPLPPPPITLPTMPAGSVNDADVGLRPDPIAQERAERYLTHVIAFRQREDDARRAARLAALEHLLPGPSASVEADDDAQVIGADGGPASDDERVILTELRRIIALSDRPRLPIAS